jgi:hypothetical protein
MFNGSPTSDRVTKIVGHADASWLISPRTAVTRTGAAMQYDSCTHKKGNVNPALGMFRVKMTAALTPVSRTVWRSEC